MAATSSTACLPTPLFKHDVFLSFRGEDTRHSFISHLHAALCRKSITTFIDSELRNGEEISQALLNAIEESVFAVVVFSKGYLSSRWCLDELAKIVECIDTRGQKVIPVFYHIDPSDVRKQTGNCAEAFVGYEANFNSNVEKLRRWRAALTKAANLSGWATKDCRSESAIVDEIVHCICKDLQKMWPSPLKGLVGIGPRIEQLQTLLCSESSGSVFMLGLWGMGGIGKTTIAKALFDQIKCRFERCCFLANVREESEKRGLEKLGKKLLSAVLEEKIKTINTPDIGQFFYMLRGIKVLVVLDDVDDRKQLEYLTGDRGWYSPGSRIIITSRDRQLLKHLVDAVYEVEALLHPDALQLFSLHAFKHNVPTDDMSELSSLVVRYAKGVPLALKVLGSSLLDKSKKEWESTIKKLENDPNKEIQDVLRTSYFSLEKKQKELFLWIAVYSFQDWSKDRVIKLLDDCGFSTEIELSVLVNKSLVTIFDFDGTSKFFLMEMHDLLREMGRKIVQEESEDPGERSWLWNHEEIYRVFRRNSGTKNIKGIHLETLDMKELRLHQDTFARMTNLKFLEIHDYNWLSKCKVHHPEGISTLPDELRYLYWDGYPLESLPAHFNPENLIELCLPNSNIIELFCDEMQDLGKSRNIDFSLRELLLKILNLSWARNVTQLNLRGCGSLCEASSSICHLSNVTLINLANCAKLRGLPDLSGSNSLRRLNLHGCSNLKTFPKVPRSTAYLDLSGTAIKEVPSASVEYLDNLVELLMCNCSQLETLPSNVDLKSLEYLYFSGCSALKKFPEISKKLQELYLDETAIIEVPSSVVCLSELRLLSLTGCTELQILPGTIWKLHFLEELHLDGCSNLTEFPQTIEEEQQQENFSLGRLQSLNFSNCNLQKLPTDLGCLHSLTVLNLRGNSFRTIPASIKQLSRLEFLFIADCKSLLSLLELPPNLQQMIACRCTSLETISAALACLVFESLNFSEHRMFNFADCMKLDEKECGDMVCDLTNFITTQHRYKEFGTTPGVSIIYMGSRIPGWFKHRSVGDSISVQFPSTCLFLGFALGIVYKPCGIAGCYHDEFRYVCHIGDNHFSHSLWSFSSSNLGNHGTETEHVLVKLDDELRLAILRNARKSQSSRDVVLFKFRSPESSLKCQGCCKIKMCGVTPLYGGREV